jgi:ribosomal protein S18 acetylase RimI-like enzyme
VQQEITDPRLWLDEVEIGVLGPVDTQKVTDVLARATRDNPLHVATFGEDREKRLRTLQRFFSVAANVLGWQEHMLAARGSDGTIIGVCGMTPPGGCLPDLGLKLLASSDPQEEGPIVAARIASWLGAWSERDPGQRHWHFGPLVVEPGLQGMGVGSRLMEVSCAQVDASGEQAYLETDTQADLLFYERFGFEVVGEQNVLGVPNWFMQRTRKG